MTDNLLEQALKNRYEAENILITGTGSWAKELCKTLLKYNPHKIIMFSRNELNSVKTREEFKDFDNVKILIGDIKDKKFLEELFSENNFNHVFHTSALKHVSICEEQVSETINTNIIGTRNLLEVFKSRSYDDNIYLVSTDKACNPINSYGLSKALAERLFQEYSRNDNYNKYLIIRSGNVLGSNGSVIHAFKEQIEKTGKVNITDENMTRFFLTLPNAIDLLLQATLQPISGVTIVTKMKSMKIVDLAKVLSKHYNLNYESNHNIIGKKPAEKLHEELISQPESENTYYINNNLMVTLPYITTDTQKEYVKYKRKFDKPNYTSNEDLMSFDEIIEMLKEGKFI